MRRFWPVAEPARADYERLRAAVVSGRGLPDELAAARFLRRGLAGLVLASRQAGLRSSRGRCTAPGLDALR